MKVIGILLIILSTGSPLAVASPALGGDAALSQEVLPKYTRPLPRGINRLTVVNPNDYDARVGLRAGKIMSRNFVVPHPPFGHNFDPERPFQRLLPVFQPARRSVSGRPDHGGIRVGHDQACCRSGRQLWHQSGEVVSHMFPMEPKG